MMYLEPCDTESHHNIGHGVGLGEQILDLFAGTDVPFRHACGLHFLLRAFGQTSAFSHGLHDLEGALFRHSTGDQIKHDVVTAADGLINGGGFGGNQVFGVAQPHVGAVGEAGQTQKRIKPGGHGIHQHPAGKAGVELRNGDGAGGAENFVILIAQHLGGDENGHGVLVVQRDGLGVDAGHVLHHADHGGIIVAQHVQLQKVFLHGVVFKMGGDLVGLRVVRRVLHRAEVPDLVFLWDDHQAAGVLAGGAPDAYASRREAGFLRPGGSLATFGQVFLYVAEGSFFRHGADGACTENVGFSEHFNTVSVGF